MQHGSRDGLGADVDRRRRPLRDAARADRARHHVRQRRPRLDARRRHRPRRGGGDPARRRHRHGRLAHHAGGRRTSRSRATTRPGSSTTSFGTDGIAHHRLSAATTTRPTTPRSRPTAGSSPSGAPTPRASPKLDFGVARYTPDGTPDQGFGADGIVRTDVLGGGDQANAVAVQPDGKIVVAGFAVRNGIDSDFAARPLRRRRQLDARLRRAAAIVTTDLGTRADDGRARSSSSPTAGSSSPAPRARTSRSRATRPPARSTPTFGQGGSTITDLGSEDVANGVALTPDGAHRRRGLHARLARQPRLPAGPLHAPTAASTPPSATTAPSRPTSAAATTSPRTSLVDSQGRIVARRPRDQRDDPRHGARPLQRRTARWTAASTATGSSPPTSTAGASSARTSRSTPPAGSSPPATRPTAPTPEFALMRATP